MSKGSRLPTRDSDCKTPKDDSPAESDVLLLESGEA